MVELDLQAGVAASEAPEGSDIKALPAVATLHDTCRLDAVRGLVEGIDGLRTWTFAHQAASTQALYGLKLDFGVEFARASSAGRALRDKIFATYIASCKDFIAVVHRDIATKESFDAEFIAESAKGKKLRMDLVKEGSVHMVRRLNFLQKTRDVITAMKDDFGNTPQEVLEMLKAVPSSFVATS